jgi:plasmid stability protein
VNEIYNAIMKAAGWIESHPKQFDYVCTTVPDSVHCGSPGCAVGWIAYFRGVRDADGQMDAICTEAMGVDYWGHFVPRMDSLSSGMARSFWRNSPDECGRLLRLYAAKYHAPKHEGIPLEVREIFRPGVHTNEHGETIPDLITIRPVDVPQL